MPSHEIPPLKSADADLDLRNHRSREKSKTRKFLSI